MLVITEEGLDDDDLRGMVCREADAHDWLDRVDTRHRAADDRQ